MRPWASCCARYTFQSMISLSLCKACSLEPARGVRLREWAREIDEQKTEFDSLGGFLRSNECLNGSPERLSTMLPPVAKRCNFCLSSWFLLAKFCRPPMKMGSEFFLDENGVPPSERISELRCYRRTGVLSVDSYQFFSC